MTVSEFKISKFKVSSLTIFASDYTFPVRTKVCIYKLTPLMVMRYELSRWLCLGFSVFPYMIGGGGCMCTRASLLY